MDGNNFPPAVSARRPTGSHHETMAGTHPNRVLLEVVDIGTKDEDPMLQFYPETAAPPTGTAFPRETWLQHEAQGGPQAPTLEQPHNVPADTTHAGTASRTLAPPRRLTTPMRVFESVVSLVGRQANAQPPQQGWSDTLAAYAHRLAFWRRLPAIRIRAPRVGLSGAHAPWTNLSVVAFVCGAAAGALGIWLLSVQPALRGTTLRQEAAPTEATPSTVSAVALEDDATAREAAAGPTAGAPPAAPAVPTRATASTPPAAAAVPTRATVSTPPTAPAVPARARTRVVARARPARSRSPAVAQSGPFHGSLAVSSAPQGAQVFVNGQPVGSTPLVLKEMPAGSRVVRVEADGYQGWSAAVRVVADEVSRVTASLEPMLPD
jgi:hypothetical protein